MRIDPFEYAKGALAAVALVGAIYALLRIGAAA